MIQEFQGFELKGKKIFVKAKVSPPFRLMAEMSNEACFYYVVKGKANVIGPSGMVETKEGDGILMECGNYFNDYPDLGPGEICECIGVHLYPEVLKMIYEKEFPETFTTAKEDNIVIEKMQATVLIENFISSLQFYFDNPELVSDDLLKLKIKELVLLLVKTDALGSMKALFNGLFSKTEFDFKTIIENNLFNPVSIPELAYLTNLSVSTFKRQFQKHYGTSPAKYIRTRRLERAAQMLKSTSDQISHIAYDCAFTDLGHFSKTFQKEFGTTPSEYRLS